MLLQVSGPICFVMLIILYCPLSKNKNKDVIVESSSTILPQQQEQLAFRSYTQWMWLAQQTRPLLSLTHLNDVTVM